MAVCPMALRAVRASSWALEKPSLDVDGAPVASRGAGPASDAGHRSRRQAGHAEVQPDDVARAQALARGPRRASPRARSRCGPRARCRRSPPVASTRAATGPISGASGSSGGEDQRRRSRRPRACAARTPRCTGCSLRRRHGAGRLIALHLGRRTHRPLGPHRHDRARQREPRDVQDPRVVQDGRRAEGQPGCAPSPRSSRSSPLGMPDQLKKSPLMPGDRAVCRAARATRVESRVRPAVS